jgi:hypothetical protein
MSRASHAGIQIAALIVETVPDQEKGNANNDDDVAHGLGLPHFFLQGYRHRACAMQARPIFAQIAVPWLLHCGIMRPSRLRVSVFGKRLRLAGRSLRKSRCRK